MRTRALPLLGALLVAGMLTPVEAAPATQIKIREVFAGAVADANAQYVMLQTTADHQGDVAGQSLTIADATGATIATFTFPSAMSSGQNQATILVGTPQAQAMFGVAMDGLISPVIPATGGRICFASLDCVTWGNYTGPDFGTGTPFNAAEGIALSAAMERDTTRGLADRLDGPDDTNDSATDFIHAAPVPRNNAGVAGTPCCGVVGFTLRHRMTPEGTVTMTLDVRRTDATFAETVAYSTVDLTATAGTDYVSTSGTLSFAPGVKNQTISVDVLNDADPECDEMVEVRLRTPSSSMLDTAELYLSIIEPIRAPNAPTALTATGGYGEITLAWSPPPPLCTFPVDGYNVYETSGPPTLVATVTSTGYADLPLAAGVTRTYQVAAFNGAGEGPLSAPASATVVEKASPPRNVTAVGGPGVGEITVSWDAPTWEGIGPVSGYRVYGGALQNRVLLATVPPTTTSYTHSGLGNNAERAYHVTAMNPAGESAQSARVIGNSFGAPGAPLNVSAAPGPADGEIRVTWSAPASNGGTPVTGYRVFRTKTGQPEQLVAVLGLVSSFTDPNLEFPASYRYRVEAVNMVGPGPKSSPSCARPAPWPAAVTVLCGNWV